MNCRAAELLREGGQDLWNDIPYLIQLLAYAVEEAAGPTPEERWAGQQVWYLAAEYLAKGKPEQAYQLLAGEGQLSPGERARFPEIMQAQNLEQASRGVLTLAKQALSWK
jgi:hypothetical protein